MIVTVGLMPEKIFFKFNLDLENIDEDKQSECVEVGMMMLHQSGTVPRVLRNGDLISIDGTDYLIMEEGFKLIR